MYFSLLDLVPRFSGSLYTALHFGERELQRGREGLLREAASRVGF